MKNANTAWGGIFYLFEQGNYLLHPTSSGFESRATHDYLEILCYMYINYINPYSVFVTHFSHSQEIMMDKNT